MNNVNYYQVANQVAKDILNDYDENNEHVKRALTDFLKNKFNAIYNSGIDEAIRILREKGEGNIKTLIHELKTSKPFVEEYMEYEKALKTIKDKNYKPIILYIGKTKRFEGVEFVETDKYLNCDDFGSCYDTWLFVKCEPKYVEYLDNCFRGDNFEIYGETRGSNFRVMGKCNTKKTCKNPKVKIINL